MPRSFGSFNATLWLRSHLVAEHDVLNLYLFARLSDATLIPLAHADAAGVGLEPLQPLSLALGHPSLVTVSCPPTCPPDGSACACPGEAGDGKPWEVSWSLSCDGSFVARGGAGFRAVVIVPRTAVHGASACSLTMFDAGADGWDGATWSGFGQSEVTHTAGNSSQLNFTAGTPAAPPHFQLHVPLFASSITGDSLNASWARAARQSCTKPWP